MCDSKGKVVVINTACFSGGWKSKYWTLLATASADQLVPLWVPTTTNALVAEYTTEFNIRPPYPASLDEHGLCSIQREHDFCPEKTDLASRITSVSLL